MRIEDLSHFSTKQTGCGGTQINIPNILYADDFRMPDKINKNFYT